MAKLELDVHFLSWLRPALKVCPPSGTPIMEAIKVAMGLSADINSEVYLEFPNKLLKVTQDSHPPELERIIREGTVDE